MRAMQRMQFCAKCPKIDLKPANSLKYFEMEGVLNRLRILNVNSFFCVFFVRYPSSSR